MAERADLLFELGTEELPPVALKTLSNAFVEEFVAGLKRSGLEFGDVHPFATPRRLGLWIESCAFRQPDRQIERRGPAVKAAFDKDGEPTRAAEGFARSCGVSVSDLARLKTDKGEWLVFHLKETGKPAKELLPAIAENALNRLPIPKRMRWGALNAQFVRPVHWLLFLHGDSVVPCKILEAQSDNKTRGHRFHHPDPIEINDPREYREKLENPGRVIADFSTRKEKIRRQVRQTAEALGGHAEIDESLLDEVAALVEWPIPIAAGFEERFLEVPHEALILTMKKNQKYFHLVDANGNLMNHFVTLANIDSPKPELIKEGNERVVRPRLSDAMFFWQQDGKRRLDERVEILKSVVFQQKLGTMFDKSERISRLAGYLSDAIGGDPALAKRAGMLSRCDLMTEMVGEFPDMQGTMGRYQARRDGEEEELAVALEEFYYPRFSGDHLPQTRTGIAISLAEKIDTLVGIFGIGQKPTGDKDPFALRRSALGALRIMLEHDLSIDLKGLLKTSADLLREKLTADAVVDDVYAFLIDRLRGLYLERGVAIDVFEAVSAVEPASVADFDRRIEAVVEFSKLPEAEALSAANKRIRNILRKSETRASETVDRSLFESVEEKSLHDKIDAKRNLVIPLLATFDYEAILVELAELREPVDHFFDEVMVMAENPDVRNNRLALLNRLGNLFLEVADISRLQA